MRLRLTEIRENRRLTQSEIAKIAGVSSKTEWNWEQGKSFPNAAQLWDIAVALDCTPNDLLGWYDDHPRESAQEPLPPEEAELMRNYRSCTPQWRANISMTARAAAGEAREEAERDVSESEIGKVV